MGWLLATAIFVINCFYWMARLGRTRRSNQSPSTYTVNYLIPDDGDQPLRPFFSKIYGVTFENPGGVNRQTIIANCDQGEALALVREPLNSHDSNAVAIFTMSGQQLGYISRDLSAEIAERLDRGSPVTARISDITGGTAERPTFGVNIEVTKHKLKRSQ